MTQPPTRIAHDEPAPDFLTHLQQAFGWNEAQALAALAGYISMRTAGRARSAEPAAIVADSSRDAA